MDSYVPQFRPRKVASREMKNIKSAYITVLLIGLVTFWITPGNTTMVEFNVAEMEAPSAAEWSEGRIVNPTVGGGNPELRINNPCNPGLYLGFTVAPDGVVEVRNDAPVSIVYIARDLRTDQWTQVQTISQHETHRWITRHRCMLFFKRADTDTR